MEQSELYRSKGDGRRERRTGEEEDVSESKKCKDRKSKKKWPRQHHTQTCLLGLPVLSCSGDANSETLILLLLFPLCCYDYAVCCAPRHVLACLTSPHDSYYLFSNPICYDPLGHLRF